MAEYNKSVNARQFLGGGAGPSGGSSPDATSSSHAIYKWVERNIKYTPGASVSIDPNTGQMIISSYGREFPVSRHDWVVQSENNMFYVVSDAKFKELYGSASEVRTTSSTGGEKGVKPERYSLIPVPALDIMARLYGFGAEKYAAHNWRKGYEWSKSFDSLFRHATAALNGEDYDPETGLPHLAGAAFHCFTLMVFMQEHPEFDDRFKPASEKLPDAPMPEDADSADETIPTWGFDLKHNDVALLVRSDRAARGGHFTPAVLPEPPRQSEDTES